MQPSPDTLNILTLSQRERVIPFIAKDLLPLGEGECHQRIG